MNDLYHHELRPYKNFFQPVIKLQSKERIASSVKSKYDVPKTPYQGLMERGQISKVAKTQLEAVYPHRNPARFRQSIDIRLDKLYQIPDKKTGSQQVNPRKKVILIWLHLL